MSHELKYLDTPFSSASTFTAGTTGWNTDGIVIPGAAILSNGWLSNLSQGVGQSQRIGGQVQAYKLSIRFSVVPNGLSTGYTQLFRFCVFTDTESDGAYPLPSELYQYSGATNPLNIFGFIELGFSKRFKVLVDKYLTLKPESYWNGSAAVTSGFAGELWHEMNFDLDHTINWDTTGSSAITNIRQGHIFFAAYYMNEITSAGVISTSLSNPPAFHGLARLRFKDTNSA